MFPSTGKFELAQGQSTTITQETNVTDLTLFSSPANKHVIDNIRKDSKDAATFQMRDNDFLHLKDLRLKGTSFEWTEPNGTKKWICNRDVHMIGGTCIWENVDIDNGEGGLIEKGAIFVNGGSTINSTYAYTLYLGNNMAGDAYIASGIIENYKFSVGRKETGLRLMGFNGLIDNCSFGSIMPPPHVKETFQARHGKFVFKNCPITLSWLIGSLDPTIDSGKHIDYAQRNPTYAYVENCTQSGYLCVSGKSFVAIDGLHVIGIDPRGVGDNKNGIWTKVYQTQYGPHSPLIYIKNSDVAKVFTNFAENIVIIGPGCTHNGVKVPTDTTWDENEFNRIKNVCLNAIPAKPEIIDPTPPAPVDPSILSVDIRDATGIIRTNISTDQNLAELPIEFTLVANAKDAGSVQFWQDNELIRTENTAPFAMYGDTNGIFGLGKFDQSAHCVTVIPFKEANGAGQRGVSLTIRFARIPAPPEVVRVISATYTYSDGTTKVVNL